MDKYEGLKEVRFLISRLEPDNIEESELEDLLKAVRKVACKDINPVFKIGNFCCFLNAYAPGSHFQTDIDIQDSENPFPSQKDLEQIMDHYGIHGKPQYSFYYANSKPSKIYLFVSCKKSPSVRKLTLDQVRILNSRAEGWRIAKIARAEKTYGHIILCRLHEIEELTKLFGFRQTWPEGVEMPFSEIEYYRALRTRDED